MFGEKLLNVYIILKSRFLAIFSQSTCVLVGSNQFFININDIIGVWTYNQNLRHIISLRSLILLTLNRINNSNNFIRHTQIGVFFRRSNRLHIFIIQEFIIFIFNVFNSFINLSMFFSFIFLFYVLHLLTLYVFSNLLIYKFQNAIWILLIYGCLIIIVIEFLPFVRTNFGKHF